MSNKLRVSYGYNETLIGRTAERINHIDVSVLNESERSLVRQLLDKQIARPCVKKYTDNGTEFYCANCNKQQKAPKIRTMDRKWFCSRCSQRLKWE